MRRKLSSDPARMPISRKLLNAGFIQEGRAKGSSPPVRRKLSQLDKNSTAVASRRNYLSGGNFLKSLEMLKKFLRTASFLRTGEGRYICFHNVCEDFMRFLRISEDL